MAERFADGVRAAQASIASWAAQLGSGWRQARRVRWPTPWRKATAVLVCGMGGSALGADLVRHAAAGQLRRPLEVANSYQLPLWARRRTLIICSSYSGNTAETLACARQALRFRLPLAVLAGGGQLANLARQQHVPAYVYHAAPLNPSGQPRLGLALQVGSLLRLLRASGSWSVDDAALNATAALLRQLPRVSAQQLAILANQAAAVVGVGPLAGAAHVVANELNENAKLFAAPFALPEVGHHLLEGLSPRRVGRKVQPVALLLEPYQVEPRLRAPLAAARAVLRRQKISCVKWRAPQPGSGGSLGEALRASQWGAWLSVALAAEAKLDPLPIPWVDLLKRQQRG